MGRVFPAAHDYSEYLYEKHWLAVAGTRNSEGKGIPMVNIHQQRYSSSLNRSTEKLMDLNKLKDEIVKSFFFHDDKILRPLILRLL